MPAESKAMQMATAIALHSPSKLYKRNRGLKRMKRSDLRDFARTKLANKPYRKGY